MYEIITNTEAVDAAQGDQGIVGSHQAKQDTGTATDEYGGTEDQQLVKAWECAYPAKKHTASGISSSHDGNQNGSTPGIIATIHNKQQPWACVKQ